MAHKYDKKSYKNESREQKIKIKIWYYIFLILVARFRLYIDLFSNKVRLRQSINGKSKNLICIKRNVIQKGKLITLESNKGSS